MTMQNIGRPTSITGAIGNVQTTTSGAKGLLQKTELLFEYGRLDVTGVDIDAVEHQETKLGNLKRKAAINLPALTEPEAVRHYVRLSQRNYAIDLGLFPLGSCTMKHNPRLNEAMARLAGFADIHPLQPQSSVQGALE